VLASVLDGGAAQRAGLSAGDVLVALEGLRVTGGNWDGLLSRYTPGATVALHAFRRDVLRCVTLTLDAPDVTEYTLAIGEGKSRAGQTRLSGWLGEVAEK
jgi:predicted metalloprotease with PDZ domain